jgi:hypothetical protein
MALNLATMHGFVIKEVTSKRTLRESMDRVIARCAKGRPHKDWEKPFREEPSKKKLAGLWFGLFNPVYYGKPVADIYVCGSTRFDPSPDDNSWAVGPDWWPEGRYAHSSVLVKLYKIAYRKDGLGNDAEYPLCLAYGSLAVRDLLRDADPSVLLGSSRSLGIAVGFDSGDFVLVGKLSKVGLVSLS